MCMLAITRIHLSGAGGRCLSRAAGGRPSWVGEAYCPGFFSPPLALKICDGRIFPTDCSVSCTFQ